MTDACPPVGANPNPDRRPARNPQCRWCLRYRKPSQWEQQLITIDEWARLCVTCANKRLNNPGNALLPMRRIEVRV